MGYRRGETHAGQPASSARDPRSETRVALVTGASRRIGIGAAIARRLAADGLVVFTTWYSPYDAASYRGSDPAEPLALLDELRRAGASAAGVEADLSNPDAPRRLFDRATREFGHVDVLVNNATHSVHDGIDNLTAAILDATYAINLRAMALLCAEYARRHSGRPHGRIVNLTSGQGLGGMPGELAYAATKGAVEAFTVSLAADRGLAGRGITVNAVDPGATDTGWIDEDTRAQWIARSPRGRLGLPEDAAKLVGFLASPDADWITGQVIHSRGWGGG